MRLPCTNVAIGDAPLLGLQASLNAVNGEDTGLTTVATFFDDNTYSPIGDFTARVDWGDGTPSDLTGAQIVSLGQGEFAVQDHHSYANAGNYTMTVQEIGRAS